MITSIRLLRNVGQFDSVATGASIILSRIALIYAENGRGKTTLAAVLRSFATGDAIPIVERKRLSATHPPHVIVEYSGGAKPATFMNNAWNRTLPELVVFDDHFVDDNIYSGLTVTSDHRQNLHELILGAQGVSLTRQLQELAEKIEKHNMIIRGKASAIPATERGELSVDRFCELPMCDNLDAAIRAAERNLAAAKQTDAIRMTPLLPDLRSPTFDLPTLEAVMKEGLPELDSSALARLQLHFRQIGDGGEAWIASGMSRIVNSDDKVPQCPFCFQSLDQSSVLGNYRVYFREEYQNLKIRITRLINEVRGIHGGDSQAAFERTARLLSERHQFWSQFAEMPNLDFDLSAVTRTWKTARDGILEALQAKQMTPLEKMSISPATRNAVLEYEEVRMQLQQVNDRLQATALSIQGVKVQASEINVATAEAEMVRLRAVKARYSPDISVKCDEYIAAKADKALTEIERDQAQDALNEYRTSAFPGFQATINLYLERFNAGFRLDSVTSTLTRGGPTCTYNILVNSSKVPVSSARDTPGQPSFRTTLSAGDRNTLALAFFFACLDHDPNIAKKTIVIDDPVSSLDEHRATTTVQEIRRLASRASQVIVLSHSKPFLCRIWEHADRINRSALTVARDGNGSTLQPWNVSDDCVTEHDRRHALLREYLSSGRGDIRSVAQAIRPVLESFSRVAYPEQFPPGTLLGPFRGECEQRLGTPQEVLNQSDIEELRDLTEYANRFHHDTNPAWQTEVINDGELQGFVRRALGFIKRS